MPAFIGMMPPMKKDHVSFQRRPFLTPILLTAIMAFGSVLVVGLAAATVWVWATSGATTVIVIRHAEKDLSSGAADPPLNQAGEARAALLAQMFGDAKHPGHVDAIYVSPALRDRLTAAPLAARLGQSVIVAPADDPRSLARRVLREHAAGRVLIVGHIDTIPALVAALGGRWRIPELAADEYGTMYIVTVPRLGRAGLLRLNY
jgi:broad specificity phosphatase PhoE